MLDTRDAGGVRVAAICAARSTSGSAAASRSMPATCSRPTQPIVLVCEPGPELEAKVRLGRIGYDRVVGALADPMRAFLERPERVEQSSRLTALGAHRRLRTIGADLQLVDVRNPGEIEGDGTIVGRAPRSRWPASPTDADRLDPRAADRRVLRGRLPFGDRGEHAVGAGFRRRLRPARRLRGLAHGRLPVGGIEDPRQSEPERSTA